MSHKSVKETHKKFISSLKKVAKVLGKEPEDVTKTEFAANDPSELSEWQMRSAGGFSSLQKLYFPKDENIVVQTGAKLINSHRNKLNTQYGKQLFLKEEILASINEVLEKHTFKVHKSVKVKKEGAKKKRAIVAHVSDTHFGANIEASEMANTNAFNWKVAARRMALFAEQIADYKLEHRKETKLVVAINGDIIAGVIHNQEFFVDLLTHQFVGTLDILTQFLGFLATKFDDVEVHCTPGNHGRAMHKGSKDRGTTHKWDSYENMIYEALKLIMEVKCPGMRVNVPKTPFAVAKVLGHNLFITHGDTVINVGNPGNSLNIRGINNQINKLNSSDLAEGDFAAVIVGHVHTPTIHLSESGAMLIVNGCLSGTDPYAQSIGIFTSNPTQQLFEVTEEHAVGDMRFIKLLAADNNAILDLIIEPYNKA